MEIATFEANCQQKKCLKKFEAPMLSDFSYGEYIYCSIDGIQVKYFCGLESQTWNFISESVDKTNFKNTDSIIQKIIGLVADRYSPNSYFTQNIYCPKCSSKYISINNNKKTGILNYENLTFEYFMSLSQQQKEKIVENLIESFINLKE